MIFSLSADLKDYVNIFIYHIVYRLFVLLSVYISPFWLLLKVYWINFNLTWRKTSHVKFFHSCGGGGGALIIKYVIVISDLTSSALYKESGDSLPNTYTPPLYSFNVTLPVTWSWLFWIHERVNSHSGLNHNPEDKKERKAVINLIELINNLLYIRINTLHSVLFREKNPRFNSPL